MFAPSDRGRTRVHKPPELRKDVLHCCYRDIYGSRSMAWELHKEDVWRQCGFESPPSRRTLSRFITDFELVAEDVFIELVHELAEQVPLGKLFRINGTNIPVDQRDEGLDIHFGKMEAECVQDAEREIRRRLREGKRLWDAARSDDIPWRLGDWSARVEVPRHPELKTIDSGTETVAMGGDLWDIAGR